MVKPELFDSITKQELPSEALVPTRIVLEVGSFERLVDLVNTPPAPTKALRELMRAR